ncbi:MAG: Penicillin-binding protein, 1A family [candidate division TM6 bacterium GW2011_GWF2_32_72]|nr:MAG: Penicillin-binding protein, 1A family [candidate division TM6 bacterium GW2011_GWF2_32_72]
MHEFWIDFSVLENYDPGQPSLLLDDEGKEWGRFQLDKRDPVSIDQIPKHLIQAFIAAEDHLFFDHCGVSFKGMIRAVLVNIYRGRVAQGASTITQQLVKLLFLDSGKNIKRKLKEQVYALLVERQFTKDQILETYLNHVYFGCGIYGVEAASQRFWGKSVKDITIDEAATLAGIVKHPNRYCPLLYPLSSQQRRNIVLYSMAERLNFIDLKTCKELQKKDVVTVASGVENLAPHLKETIRIFLEDLLGKEMLYSGGLKIQTTLNAVLQQVAEKQFRSHFLNLKKRFSDDVDGALISINSKTGEVKALVGGFDFEKNKWNRALQARRQFGSIFKPIVYAAAIQDGMRFDDVLVDEPLEVIVNNILWCPKNHDDTFVGKMTLAKALATSNNIVSAKVLLKIGVNKVVDLANQFNFSGRVDPVPALALGCLSGTAKDAVGMYNVFANHGVYVEPHFLKWVKTSFGKKFWKSSVKKHRILDSQISDQVAKVMSYGMERVRRNVPKKWLNVQSIGKTGTTNDSRTCWFCGATPELTTALYIGYDDNRSLGLNVYPPRTIVPIWLAFNKALDCKEKEFVFDPSLRERWVDLNTGKEVSFKSENAIPILI